MLVTVIVTLCLASGSCVEKVVTDQASFASCMGAYAMQVLPKWMEENGYTARGYRLAKWGCVLGSKGRAI